MKGYLDLFKTLPAESCSIMSNDVSTQDDTETIEPPAKMLGSSIADGRYNGFSDGEAGLLHGMYDDDSSLSVDPLCDFSTDLNTLKPTSSTPPAESKDSE